MTFTTIFSQKSARIPKIQFRTPPDPLASNHLCYPSPRPPHPSAALRVPRHPRPSGRAREASRGWPPNHGAVPKLPARILGSGLVGQPAELGKVPPSASRVFLPGKAVNKAGPGLARARGPRLRLFRGGRVKYRRTSGIAHCAARPRRRRL